MNNAATIYYASKIFNEKLREADRRNFAQEPVTMTEGQTATVSRGDSSGKPLILTTKPGNTVNLQANPATVIQGKGLAGLTPEEQAAVTGKPAASAAKQEVAAAVNGKPTIKGWQASLQQVFSGLTRGSAGKEHTKTARFKFESLVIPFFAKTEEIQNSNSFSNLVGKSIADGFGQIPTTGAQDSVALEKLGMYKGLNNLGEAIMKAKPENAKMYNTAFKQLMNKGYWLAIYANQKRKIDNPERHEKLYAIWSSRERQAAIWVKNTKIFLKAVIDGVKPVFEGYPKLTNEEEKQWKEGTAKGAEPSTGAQSSASASSSSVPTSFLGEFFYKNDLNKALERVCGLSVDKWDAETKALIDTRFMTTPNISRAIAGTDVNEGTTQQSSAPDNPLTNTPKNFARLIEIFQTLEFAERGTMVDAKDYQNAMKTVKAIGSLTLQDWNPDIRNIKKLANVNTDIIKAIQDEAGKSIKADGRSGTFKLETANYGGMPDQLADAQDVWKAMRQLSRQITKQSTMQIPSATVQALLLILNMCLCRFDT